MSYIWNYHLTTLLLTFIHAWYYYYYQYMQIDSHMHFLQDWDKSSISILTQESSFLRGSRIVLSYLPYSNNDNTSESKGNHNKKLLPQICNGYFSNGPWDAQIIRLNTTSVNKELSPAESTPASSEIKKNPFVVAGNLMTASGMVSLLIFSVFCLELTFFSPSNAYFHYFTVKTCFKKYHLIHFYPLSQKEKKY